MTTTVASTALADIAEGKPPAAEAGALLSIDTYTQSARPEAVFRAVFAVIAATCLVRRPGRHPLTGDLLPGATETDHFDYLPCNQPADHDGDHRDCLRRPWPVAEGEGPR